MKLVRSMAMKKLRSVTWCLCDCERVAKSHNIIASKGRPPAYKNIIAVKSLV